ncbi:MAG: CrcB family protein [Armatimonadetes bacterium]|nr:MAG: CrcB family protein [Armatimonadota bacterium]
MPKHLRELAFVFAGGAAGTALRVAVTVLGDSGRGSLMFVNLVGAFCLGWFLARGTYGAHVNRFFAVGFLGSFTTFSAFALESVVLADDGAWLGSAVWIVASVALGVAAAVAGRSVAGRPASQQSNEGRW